MRRSRPIKSQRRKSFMYVGLRNSWHKTLALSSAPYSLTSFQNDRPSHNHPLKPDPNPQYVARNRGSNFVKYTATVVYEQEKAMRLSSMHAADIHGELCRAFDQMKLPHPSGQNVHDFDVKRGSVTLSWYTGTRYSVCTTGHFSGGKGSHHWKKLARMVKNALMTEYRSPEYVEVRKLLGM